MTQEQLSYSTVTGTIEELLAINGLNLPKIRLKIQESKDDFSLIDNNRKFPNYFANKIGTIIDLPVIQFHIRDVSPPKLLKAGDKVTLDISVIEYELQGEIKALYTGYQFGEKNE
jgi:hypothetical protein